VIPLSLLPQTVEVFANCSAIQFRQLHESVSRRKASQHFHNSCSESDRCHGGQHENRPAPRDSEIDRRSAARRRTLRATRRSNRSSTGVSNTAAHTLAKHCAKEKRALLPLHSLRRVIPRRDSHLLSEATSLAFSKPPGLNVAVAVPQSFRRNLASLLVLIWEGRSGRGWS
jgi:hypothetical protein